MLTHLGDVIELVARYVVTKPVARILAEPVVAGTRVDVTADAIANAERHGFSKTVSRVDVPDLRRRRRRQAFVTGRPERDVEPAILVEGKVFPAMRHIGRHIVVGDLALRHAAEIGFCVRIFVQLVDVGDVECSIAEGDAGGYGQSFDDGLNRALAALIGDGEDLADAEPGADKQRALVAEGHLSRGRYARPQFNLEAGRQLDLLE